MSENPLVTVIVPYYHHSSDVARSVGGIFRQTVQIFELMVVDDCSQDNSVEVIERILLQTYFRFITNKKNLGLIQNLNHVVFNEAKGGNIKVIAADDFLILNYLALLTPEFTKQNDNCAFVYDKIQCFKIENHMPKILPIISGQKTCLKEVLFGKNSIPAATVMFPRQHEVAIQ